MKLFVWDNIDHVTNSWHNGGGLVVIADNIERARQLARDNGVADCPHDTKECHRYSDADGAWNDLNRNPDLVLEVNSDEEKCIVFPNAGCC